MQRSLDRLEYYYQAIHATILAKQNPVSGLIPASVAITTHGDYTDAWVRDNVYSIYAVYGLALAYRRVDNDNGRAYELEHAVVKLMRGLLFAMMRQAAKVEKFKQTQSLEHALHAKYSTSNGETVVGDFDWGHLQIDATSLFLLVLADMTTSGLTIIYTQDEVDFVQNLVFYIERAYRTPDYGIWERGNKSNHGQPELNSSSIGMALAALRALNGVNLFGARGGPSSVIHVLPDELTRNSTTLHSFLPRESNSKEIDGSVLSIIGFPAFAVDDPELIRQCKQEAKEKLEGRYGWKRFLRDGHQTVLEDTSRLHYNLNELKIFENIESEWPLFFTYLLLDGLFSGNLEQAAEYLQKLEPLIIDSMTMSVPVSPGGGSKHSISSAGDDATLHIPLLPELYYVPAAHIEAEKANPHSQPRVPNDNLPLVWALSLYFLGCLMEEDLLSPSEIDPLGRRFNAIKIKRRHIVQIVLLSEDSKLQSTLSMYGLETQTVDEIGANITVLGPGALVDVYAGLGRNAKLGLTGRPKRSIGVLGTSRLYRIQGHIYAFTPNFMDNEEFYLNSDPDYLRSVFESELRFTSQNWFYPGRPTMVVVLTHALLGTVGRTTDRSKKNLLNFFMNLRCGECGGVRVRLCRLAESVSTSNIESLDFLICQPDMNWEGILRVANRTAKRRRSRSIHRKLGYDEGETQAATTPGTKTPKRRNMTFQGKSLASPLDRLNQESYFEEISQALARLEEAAPKFRLKDPEVSPVPSAGAARKAAASHIDSPAIADDGLIPENRQVRVQDGSADQSGAESPANAASDVPGPDMLSLTLGDPSQFHQAIESLAASVNLYDQIDLLQYLASCQSLDYYVNELEATIKELIEEVYLKSMRLQYWSIARQAAGLLRKIVPSLTINITDLVIRQKQVSIGSGPQEYLISMPTSPDALGQMISEHCNDDIREGPVVQEIIMYLGSFIRTMPQMFDGILRLRTHYIIIALREEIRRMNDGYDEQDAVEHLMQLSPFELRQLLGSILSGPGLLCDSGASEVRDNGYWMPLVGGKDKLTQDNEIVVRAQSGGFTAGNFAWVEIDGVRMDADSRGIHLWAMMDRGGPYVLLERASFDTHISEEESQDLKRFIDSLALGTIVVVAAKDDFTEHLTKEAVSALESLGSKKIRQVGYRDSFVMVAEKKGASTAAEEAHSPASAKCPTVIVESHFKVHTEKKKASPEEGGVFPHSRGRWLRRRKNDGALNRVPPQFFPRTWQILDSSQGLKIHQHVLPRDPTVLEKTAEEFNFALVVEGFLGWFADPAERQIAVETLMVIYKLKERNPEMRMMDDMIDLVLIMDQAVEYFWQKYRPGGDEDSKEKARQSFYDLPQQGSPDSTFAYLAKAALKVLPFEFDYSDAMVS